MSGTDGDRRHQATEPSRTKRRRYLIKAGAAGRLRAPGRREPVTEYHLGLPSQAPEGSGVQ